MTNNNYVKADIISVHGLSRQSIFIRPALTEEVLKVQYFFLFQLIGFNAHFIHIYSV